MEEDDMTVGEMAVKEGAEEICATAEMAAMLYKAKACGRAGGVDG